MGLAASALAVPLRTAASMESCSGLSSAAASSLSRPSSSWDSRRAKPRSWDLQYPHANYVSLAAVVHYLYLPTALALGNTREQAGRIMSASAE